MTQANALNFPWSIGSATSLDLTATGLIALLSTPPGGNFIATAIVVYCTQATAVTGVASVSVGSNIASFNDIIPITPLTNLDTAGKYLQIIANTTTAVIVPPSTLVRVNITTGATATSQRANVYLLGYYI